MGEPVTLDFSKAQPVAPPGGGVTLDFSKAQTLSGAKREEPGFLDRTDTAITSALATNPRNLSSVARTNAIEVPKTLGRELYSGAKAIAGAPSAIYHSFADPETEQEKTEYGKLPEDPDVIDKIGLGVGRMTAIPIKHAIQDYSSGKVTPEAALENAPEAIGQGAGTVVGGKLTEMAAPKVAGAARGAAKATVPPIVRGIAKGTNAALDKAPGSIGLAAGGAIGHATGIPGASELGAGVGYALGKEILPRLRVPGENFGIAKPVYPGAHLPESPGYNPGAPFPENPGTFPGAHLPENPGVFPGAHLPEHPGTFPGAPLPETPAPEVLQANSLSRGPQRIADPAAALKRIAPPGKAGSMVRSISEPTNAQPTITAAPVDAGKLGDLLNEGTGGELPEGHTPVKGSSLIRSYKYDPATKEFEAGLNGDSKTPGGVYVHGDVEPEAVAKFEATKSKGAAWKELKDTPGVTYVGKIVNGERVYAKPPRDLGSASPNDLTPILQDSLDAVKAKKAARIARPN